MYEALRLAWLAIAAMLGCLAGVIFVEAVNCLLGAAINLAGVAFSQVRKAYNARRAVSRILFGVVYLALIVLLVWISRPLFGAGAQLFHYTSWYPSIIAVGIGFLATVLYVGRNLPGRVLVARLCAWTPGFLEEVLVVRASERIAFANKFMRNQKPSRSPRA